MIEDVFTTALEPFTTTEGWLAFTFGLVGRLAVMYARNFIETISPNAQAAGDETEKQIEEDSQ